MSEMNIYIVNGSEFWYKDGEQPSCAVKKEKAKGTVTNKSAKPTNKAVSSRKK